MGPLVRSRREGWTLCLWRNTSPRKIGEGAGCQAGRASFQEAPVLSRQPTELQAALTKCRPAETCAQHPPQHLQSLAAAVEKSFLNLPGRFLMPAERACLPH